MNDKALYVAEPAEREEMLNRISETVAVYPEIAFAYVYGSFLESYGFHDIDLGIYFRPELLEGGSRITEGLERKLEASLCLPVDVRVLNEAPISFFYHVVRGRLAYEGDPELHAEVLESVIARYFDLQPLLNAATVEAFGR